MFKFNLKEYKHHDWFRIVYIVSGKHIWVKMYQPLHNIFCNIYYSYVIKREKINNESGI